MSKPPFDAETIRALASLLVETGLTEIEVDEKGGRIRVARQAVFAAAPFASAASPAPAQVPPAEETIDAAQHPGAVKSPMVGIAYLAPDPASPHFVTLGQAVAAGQTLLLVEAMKTFNQIKAPRAGKVTRILVQSGTPVEYDEPLMILE
ncbi:MAG: acetyl-CoA carboxylase biotin carboxyl carrier protein [Acetobacteraceae bacterium]